MSEIPATPDPERAILVVHRLAFDLKKTELLARCGIDIVSAKSTTAAVQVIEGARGPVVVVVDVATGGASPETLQKALAKVAQHGARPTLVTCATSRVGSLQRRASRLGVSEVYLWPEGAYAAVLRAFSSEPGFQIRRIGERAVLAEGIVESPDQGLAGRVLNLSSSGAMIELEPRAPDEVWELSIDLIWPGAHQKMTTVARVVWRDDTPTRTRMGVQFIRLDEAARSGIESFVHDCNVIGVKPGDDAPSTGEVGEATKVRVRRDGDKRVDYFLLRGDLDGEAQLDPAGPFFVQFQIGDRLVVKGANRLERTVEIVQQIADIKGGRVGWRVKGAPPVTSP